MKYEFRCLGCGNIFIRDIPLSEFGNISVECSICHSKDTKRVYSPNPIHFKGKGFYKNDNRKPNERRKFDS